MTPLLPDDRSAAAPTAARVGERPEPGSTTRYRTEDDRARSVRRRANPWYRRIVRAAIGLGALVAAATVVYLGIGVVQDYLDDEELPAAGADAPTIRSTTFLVRSSSPAPTLDGTLTIDTASGAYQYVGAGGAGAPHVGLEVVSADGTNAMIHESSGAWRAATPADGVVTDLGAAIGYLSDDTTADAILPTEVRDDHVELVARVTEGTGDDAITRFELELDTRRFGDRSPIAWQQYRRTAIPGVEQSLALPVTLWVDGDEVLVRVDAPDAGWSWERLTYSASPFAPPDPSAG